ASKAPTSSGPQESSLIMSSSDCQKRKLPDRVTVLPRKQVLARRSASLCGRVSRKPMVVRMPCFRTPAAKSIYKDPPFLSRLQRTKNLKDPTNPSGIRQAIPAARSIIPQLAHRFVRLDFFECLGLDLADAFARHAEFLADFF